MTVISHVTSKISDCIGIGFGPSNIALAIAMEEIGQLDRIIFLEQAAAPDWQGEFLIAGSDIQHNPLRDFVTPRNPTSPYGFLSYLKAEGRLFDFLNLEAPFPPRSEYARYVVWAARKFDHCVRYSNSVRKLTHVEINGTPVVQVETTRGDVFYGRTVSFGPGRSLNIPDAFRQHMGQRVVHANQYRSAVSRWQHEGGVRQIAVLGASQSAVEMLLSLPSEFPDARITNICRSFGIKQKDLSPLTERIYEPNFVDTFYAAPEATQAELRSELWRSNYGAADHDVLGALHFRLYEQKVTGRETLRLIENSTVTDIKHSGSESAVSLTLQNRMDGAFRVENFDAVILATGFLNHGGQPGAEPFHPLLSGVADHARFRKDGAISQKRDYRIDMNNDRIQAPIFLNGVSETTHGFGDAGSFSLLSMRSAEIAASIVASVEKSVSVTSDLASLRSASS